MAFEKVSLTEWLKVNERVITDTLVTENMYYSIELPTRSTTESAGYDFRMPFDLKVKAHTKYTIPTGIKADLSKLGAVEKEDGEIVYVNINAYLALYPRSSYGMIYGFKLLNTTAIIDADYYDNSFNEGHIMVAFETDKDIELKAGNKFCQGILTPYYVMDGDTATGTRSGGIGSTGK